MEVALFVTLGLVLFVLGSFWWAKKQTTLASKLRCISVFDVDDFIEIQKILEENSIHYNQRTWSNHQQSYKQFGIYNKAPKEVWIPQTQFEHAQNILSKIFLIEVTEFAIKVKSKISLK